MLCKNIFAIDDISVPYSEKTAAMYNKKDEKYEIRGPYATWPLDTTSMGDRPNLRFPITHQGIEIWPEKQWLWSKERVLDAQKNNLLEFNPQSDGSFKIRFKGYLRDENGVIRRGKPLSILEGPYTQEGSKDFQQLLAKSIFPFPKPTRLLTQLFSISTNFDNVCEGIVLDFFSGSATTAHAVLQHNAEDGGNRKFIMVQLPEPCDEKSEAFKAGYKTIAEIGKERIRRAGKKIKEENPMTTQNLDIGFRVFKVDTSNMKDVYYAPDELKQGNLELFKDHIKPDRRPEDLLFQVFLDWGLDLTLPIAKKTIDGKKVFVVDTDALIACFDSGITEELVKKLAKHKPLRAVFRDDAFGSDSVKINVEQIFKLLSPGTEVKSI